jgi:class 3 adenylate cyclase
MSHTVVELDLVDFTERARRMEALVGPEGVQLITERVRGFVLGALREIRIDSSAIRSTAGDGMILLFDSPDDADRFATEFHETWAAHNAKQADPAYHYLFRLGIGTGDLAIGDEVAGTKIIDARRLESGGKPGHVLIDPPTYDALSPARRGRYGQCEYIRVKGKEKDGTFPAHRRVVAEPSTRPSGWVKREYVIDAKKRLPDEVFAVELLRRPITLERSAKGLTVTVDRTGVEDMLISNDGKRAAVAHYIPSRERQDELAREDREIHQYLAGRGNAKPYLVEPERLRIRLRWASGGVLSIIKLTGDPSRKEWVPCFFRDIRPYGWNISLGASERAFDPENHVAKDYSLNHELSSPLEYIVREFLEESLVIAGTPRRGAQLRVRRFAFQDPLAIATALSRDFGELHRAIRTEEDGFEMRPDKHMINVERRPTDCKLIVEHGAGAATTTEDVLICFSLLDLGIEVIRVIDYELAPADTLLDGELQAIDALHNGNPRNELVRMPMALLSLDYLREMFHANHQWQTYTRGPQPSLIVPRPPDSERDEIRMFEWDTERRMSILSNPAASHTQAKRFLDWYDKFGANFVDASGRASSSHPSRPFVPSMGKVLNLLFAQPRPRVPSRVHVS